MGNLIQLYINGTHLQGALDLPEQKAMGVVLFAHGSGSSRLSPRNLFVADVLRRGGIATFLVDLLTEEEDSDYKNRFDIMLLSDRLAKIANWLKENSETRELPIGLFGASTGAAAALNLAAVMGHDISAVVSRGGRPDLITGEITKITSPTLLIVGGNDIEVLGLNKETYDKLQCEKELKVIKGATHLFEEPGALEEVAELAFDWFKKHFKETQ